MKRLRRLIDLALDHPRRTLAAFLLITAGWGLAIPRLYLATDGRSLLPPDHPVLRFQAEVDAAYAAADFVVVGLAAPAPARIFTPAALGAVLRLSRELEELPGVDPQEVRSLATVFSPKWSEFGLRLEPPLEVEVDSAAEAARVAELARADPLFDGVLVSPDGRATAIYAALEPDADRRRLLHRIEELVATEGERLAPAGVEVHLLGPVAAESLLGDHVLADLATLLPLALAVVALLLWVWFRSPAVVAAGLAESAVIVVWGLGLMGALGKGISLVTVVMPVILATYCVADTIHLAQRFQNKCAELPGRSRREALGAAMDEVLAPVVYTSLTTCAGFLGFAVSPLPPVRDFGLFCAAGILSALVTSLLMVPAALLVCGFGSRRRAPRVAAAATRWLERTSLAAARRPRLVVAALLAACLLLGAGGLRLTVQDSWVENFDPESPLVRSDRWFNANFFGSNILNAVVEAGAPGAAYDPSFMAAMADLQEHLGARLATGGSRSLADQMAAVGRTLEGEARLPRDRGEAEEWNLLLEMAGGRESLEPYVDESRSAANLWIFLNRADYRKTAAAVAAVGSFDDWPEGEAVAVRFAGDAYLGHLLIELIARSSRLSLLAALAVNLLVVWLMLRSLVDSVLVVLPVSIAVLWNFGFMGWVGLPLGVATSTFSAIALGIGVDLALHWLAKLRLSIAAGDGWMEAVGRTARTTGGAILLNGVVLLAGFGVLLFSGVPPNQRLGLLIAVNLLACLATTLLLLPAVTALLRGRRRAAGLGGAPAAGAFSSTPSGLSN